MRGVAFLPEELTGSQEEPSPHFPPHDVRPLVDQQRKITIGLDPPAECIADDRLAGGADDERLFQVHQQE